MVRHCRGPRITPQNAGYRDSALDYRPTRLRLRHSLSENHNSCYQQWAGSSATGQNANSPRRPGGKAPAAGRQGEKKANSGSFDGKLLISFKTAKEKAII
jgi:hypothetical protein